MAEIIIARSGMGVINMSHGVPEVSGTTVVQETLDEGYVQLLFKRGNEIVLKLVLKDTNYYK